jgi:cell division protein FtsW
MKVAVTTLAFCAAALLALGLVMLYSSSWALLNRSTHVETGARDLIMQLIWCAVGFVFCVAATAIDYQWLRKLVWPVFIFALFMLGSVFVPHLGRASHGAHRWIGIGPFTFQPSELGKITLIIVLAWYGDQYQRQMHTFKRGIIFPAALAGVILGLIFVEPDRGTTILLSAVAGAMLLVAGVQWKHVLIPVAAGAAALTVSILHDPMRMGRIMAWRHPQDHLNGAALQAQQAMLGLGNGGWFGVGLGNGVRKFGYLPEIHTDFIFANIGEELGLVATLFVVVAFVVMAICGLYIAMHARDTFGLLLASGITFLISLQAAINIGVVTSALPNKGLPLPFISYGGSNLLAMLTCIGLLFSVARQAQPREKVSEPVVDHGDNPFAAKAT